MEDLYSSDLDWQNVKFGVDLPRLLHKHSADGDSSERCQERPVSQVGTDELHPKGGLKIILGYSEPSPCFSVYQEAWCSTQQKEGRHLRWLWPYRRVRALGKS